MEIWALAIVIILLIAALSLGGFLYYQNQIQLQKENQNNLYKTFSVKSDGDSSQTQAVLSCPSGRVINILDAWYEVNDPYFQCTDSPTGCAPGIDNSGKNGLVWSEKCPSYSSRQGTVDGDVWEETTASDGKTGTYKNKVCAYDKEGSPTSTSSNVCASMNALQYIANIANGQNQVTVSGKMNGDFGPCPCDSDTDSNKKEYLPVAGQYNSANPESGSTTVTNGYQGYYAHGIYQCVVDDEVIQK